MATVDVRELANCVTDYVARARSGETIVVTENDKPVVTISPFEESTDAVPMSDIERLRQMAARGEIRWNGGKPVGFPRGEGPRMKGEKTMSDIVIEDRGER